MKEIVTDLVVDDRVLDIHAMNMIAHTPIGNSFSKHCQYTRSVCNITVKVNSSLILLARALQALNDPYCQSKCVCLSVCLFGRNSDTKYLEN